MPRLAANSVAHQNTAAALAAHTAWYNPKFATQNQYDACIASFVTAGVGGAGTDAQREDFLLRVGLAFADAGTSPSTDYSQIDIRSNVGNAPCLMSTVVRAIKNHTTARRFARQIADLVYDHAKNNGISFAVGQAHGMPASYGYLGFDFADGVTPSKLSNEEAMAIEAAKRVGLFKAAAAAVTNTSALFHHGAPAPSRAPAGLLTQ